MKNLKDEINKIIDELIVIRRYIQDCARRSRNGFYVTIFKEGKAQKYFEYDKIYADMADVILRDIYDYFNSNSNKQTHKYYM